MDDEIKDLELDQEQDEQQYDSMSPYVVRGLSQTYSSSVTRAKVIATIVGGIILLFLSIFLVSQAMAKDSKMVINAVNDRDAYISLSETIAGFDNGEGSTILYAEGKDKIPDIDGFREVQRNRANNFSIMDTDGSHNGDRFIAYTFYLKNVGDATLYANMTMHIELVTKSMDEAVRIELYTQELFLDAEPTLIKYAKESANGSPELFASQFPELGYCTNFLSKDQIMSKDFSVPVDGIVKYTVVMYLEGWDNECTDPMKSGSFGFSISFTKKSVNTSTT